MVRLAAFILSLLASAWVAACAERHSPVETVIRHCQQEEVRARDIDGASRSVADVWDQGLAASKQGVDPKFDMTESVRARNHIAQRMTGLVRTNDPPNVIVEETTLAFKHVNKDLVDDWIVDAAQRYTDEVRRELLQRRIEAAQCWNFAEEFAEYRQQLAMAKMNAEATPYPTVQSFAAPTPQLPSPPQVPVGATRSEKYPVPALTPGAPSFVPYDAVEPYMPGINPDGTAK